jgi:hypothetical protein
MRPTIGIGNSSCVARWRLLLTPFDIFSDGFGRALDRFGGDRQTGQELHLLSPPIEGSFMTHGGQHTAYPR